MEDGADPDFLIVIAVIVVTRDLFKRGIQVPIIVYWPGK